MKRKAELIITLFFSLAIIEYMFSFVLVEAAKIESGATIKKSLPPLEVTCVDNNGDGVDDNTGRPCGSTEGPPTYTVCGLEIVSGVPIKYGELYPGQLSTEQKVVIKDVGIPGKVMIEGGDWISDAEGNPIISGPEITHVDRLPNVEYSQKNALADRWVTTIPGSGQLVPIYFQFKVPINGNIGSIHQDIKIDISC